ncbi:MAG: ankyrin repeat domain-containing protein [Solirubrobacteraceae bacterium]
MEATAERFARFATEGRCDQAEATLAARPELEHDRWVGLLLGRGWDGDANTPGGPLGWSPLHYVCHSAFGTVALARELLDRGADPNAFYANSYGPMSALYGAAGVRHDPELTALLLERGADPNGEPHFGDALYHSVEARDPACTRLLLEAGAKPRGSAALAHALDYERPEHVRLLLERGAARDDAPVLVHAVRRGRDLATIRALLDAGAEIDRRGGEWSTPPEHWRTAYSNAVLRNRDDVAALLAERGAQTAIEHGDRAVAAVARGERPPEPLPDRPDNDQQEVLALAALDGHLDLVVERYGPGFFAHVGGGPPGTLLHHACWVGDAALVARLLELGADPVARSGAEYDTPAEWAQLASGRPQPPGRDYDAVIELLARATSARPS